MDDNVTTVDFGGHPFPQNDNMADAVMGAVMEFAGRVSLMEAVGVLRIVEHRLLTDVHWENV